MTTQTQPHSLLVDSVDYSPGEVRECTSTFSIIKKQKKFLRTRKQEKTQTREPKHHIVNRIRYKHLSCSGRGW